MRRWVWPALLALAAAGCAAVTPLPAPEVMVTAGEETRGSGSAAGNPVSSTVPPPHVTASAEPPPSPNALESFGPGRVEIPILLYHHIAADRGGTRYTISTETFRTHMDWLADAGFQTVTVSDVAAAIRNGADLPVKPIVLTFDDGNRDVYEQAFPILEGHGFRGVVFAVGNRTGSPGFLDAAAMQALLAGGWEIGSHSMTHVDLTTVGDVRWRHEILDSRLELESVLGIPVEVFAYPFGSATAPIIGKVAQYGYQSGVGIGRSRVHDRGNLFYLMRLEVSGRWTMEEFQAALGSDS